MISFYDRDGRPPTRLAFHPSRIVIDVGVLLVLGSMSLPFVSAVGFQQRAVAADALPALLLLLPVFALTLVPDQSAPLPNPLAWTALGLAAAALPYTVFKYLDAATLAHTLRGSIGVGARILVFGGVVTLAGIGIGFALAWSSARRPATRPEPQPADGAFPAGSGAAAGRGLRRGRLAPSPGIEAPAGGPPGQPGATPTAVVSRTRLPHRRPAGRPTQPQQSAEPGGSQTPPPQRIPPKPLAADPETEPTLPAQRPVQPWWPDDLEDLFS